MNIYRGLSSTYVVMLVIGKEMRFSGHRMGKGENHEIHDETSRTERSGVRSGGVGVKCIIFVLVLVLVHVVRVVRRYSGSVSSIVSMV